MTTQYHVDGRLVPAEEATVHVEDRGFAYGDAAFETMRAYGGTVFALEAHLDRLERTSETLGFAEALPPRWDLADRIDETLAANDLADASVKLSVSRGVQPGKLTPEPRVDPTVVVSVEPLPRGGVEGPPVWDAPASLEPVPVQRVPDDALPSDAKTHNYLNGVLARLALRRGGGQADEALLLDGEGRVTEGATSNVFFVADGTLHTPSRSLSLLPGITRAVVLELARAEEFPVETGHYTVGDLRAAEEVFLTNTTWEVRPVEVFDGRDLTSGPITQLLARLFDERVEAECY